LSYFIMFFFFQAEDGIRDVAVTGVQTCALPIYSSVAGPVEEDFARARKIFLDRPGDGRVQRGKNKIAIECRRDPFYNQVARCFGNGCLEVPANGFGVRPSRRSFRSGNLRQFEPRVFGEQLHQSLPDDAGRTENSGVPFSSHVLDPLVFLLASRRLAIPPVPSLRVHAAPPDRSASERSPGGPIRVPRACGLKVLRTHTTISLSAASGSTLGCSTFAPPRASACASS